MSVEPINVSIPILPSSDPAAAVAFWRELGFDRTAVFGDHGYGIAGLDNVEFHFLQMEDRHVAENTSCYIRVDDVDAWFARMEPNVKAPARISDAPIDQVWGMREFFIWDRDGVLFKFGQIND